MHSVIYAFCNIGVRARRFFCVYMCVCGVCVWGGGDRRGDTNKLPNWKKIAVYSRHCKVTFTRVHIFFPMISFSVVHRQRCKPRLATSR